MPSLRRGAGAVPCGGFSLKVVHAAMSGNALGLAIAARESTLTAGGGASAVGEFAEL